MGKKISIVLVTMLCLSMFPWASIGVSNDAKNVKTAETLKVDAWIESKLAKPGDTIEIYANTSYTEGVSVSADIMEYEHNEDIIASSSLDNLDLSGMIYTTYVSTVSLTYDSTEKHWVGTYTIPSSAGGVYVADVTATDGVNTVNDNATVHLQNFYDEHLKPVQDKAETFLYGEFNDTVNDIKENLIALNDTINAHGGIRGIVENLTGLSEWQALLDASYDVVSETEHYLKLLEKYPKREIVFTIVENYNLENLENKTDAFNFTVYEYPNVDILALSIFASPNSSGNITLTLIDPEGDTYIFTSNISFPFPTSFPVLTEWINTTPGIWKLNVTTSGNGSISININTYQINFTYSLFIPENTYCLNFFGETYIILYKPGEPTARLTITDPDKNVYTTEMYYNYTCYHEISNTSGTIITSLCGRNSIVISQPVSGEWIINVTTLGGGELYIDVSGYLMERSKIACFLDNLTKFILSDEYENIISMVPELKSFIFGIPTEPDMMIDYLLGFNLTHYLNKIKGAEGIFAAYNALMNSENYSDFKDALDALQASETYWNMENLSVAIMDLFMSDEMMNLLNATAEYLQGNDTALQRLMNSFVALDGTFNSQLENLMKLPEFQNLMGAVMNNTNLSPVYESINTTFNNIKTRVETMMNSTQLQDLKTVIENVQRYAESNVLYESEWFSEDETFNYNYTVKDWVKELYLDLSPSFVGYYDYENNKYVPGTGNITVTLTDPNGVVYTYTEAYNGSEYSYWDEGYYEYGVEEKQKPSIFGGKALHDYTILFPTPGNWTVNVATSGGDGNYNLNIGPKDDFMTYMLKESMEEIFFVFNAGIAVETEYFQTIGTNGSAKLIAYDANGRIANEEIHVIVSRNTGGMAGATGIIPAAIVYVWVSGFMPASEAVQVTPLISWIQSSGYDNSSVITIESITPQQSINPDDVRWSFGEDGSSVDGVLSTSGITVDDVTVTWYDNDDNYLLSAGDTINVYKSGKPLAGYHFKLSYLPTDSAMLEITFLGKSVKDRNPNEAPVAVANVPSPMLTGISYSFDASGSYDPDGYIVEYEWNFGDGNYGYGEYVGHTYTEPGTYTIILTVTDNETAQAQKVMEVTVVEAPGVEPITVWSPFMLFPTLMQNQLAGIVYEATVTTDPNGEATINFPVEEFGIYTIDAYFEDENKIGFGESAFIGESHIPEIGLTQIGKFAGIPVYENPNKIGENITFDVTVPEGENATVGIAPLPLNELFPDINMSYESSDTIITGPENVSLQVNGPVSLIAVVTGMPVGEAEYEEYNEGYTSYPDTSFSIPQFNVSFGILLTSNVSVSLDVPSILKGERSQIDVSATGTPVITYGVACYANGLDIMSLDVTTLSTMIYESAVYQKEYNLTDVMELMKSMICGPGNSAFVTIPKLAVDGDYSFITLTNVDNTDIGTVFTSVNVYAEAGKIPAVTSSGTVDNKDVAVTYVGSGKVTIKKATVTPSSPANVKHIGIFVEVDTTGTIHNAFITIKYNNSDVVDIDESKLRMYYYDETEGTWKSCNEIGTTGVDTENNIVWANVTHFTIFAPMAEKSAAGPAPISWMIYVGVISAVIIILVISLAVTVKRKKKALPPSP